MLTRLTLWLLPLSFLAAFFYVPLLRVFSEVLDARLAAPENLRIAFDVLGFTVWQASLSTLFTLALGIPTAFLLTRYRFPGRALVRTVTAVPFMLPTVVVAAGFNALLGPHGLLNLILMRGLGLETPPIKLAGTLGAIILAHVFYNSTIVIRMVSTALGSLSPRLEPAARSLGADGPRFWSSVLLPMLRPAVLGSALLVFLFDFTSFGVVLLLGAGSFSTLEVEIFVRVLRLPNLPLAALLSLIQLLFTLLILWLYARVSGGGVQSAPSTDEADRGRSPGSSRRLVVSVASGFLLFFFLAPLLVLPVRSVWRVEADRGQRLDVQAGLTVDYYRELFVNRFASAFYVPPIRAAANSLVYAAATVGLSLLLGWPAAWALAGSSNVERSVNSLLMLPLGASAVTLGLGLILTYGRGLSSPAFVPLAHTLVALPFVIRILQPAVESIPRRLRQAAAALGASPLRVWATVDWPIVGRSTVAAAVFTLTISLGEFGAALLITRPEYPTIPVAIYRFLSQPGGANYGQAMAMATILMVLTGLCVFSLDQLRLPGRQEI